MAPRLDYISNLAVQIPIVFIVHVSSSLYRFIGIVLFRDSTSS